MVPGSSGNLSPRWTIDCWFKRWFAIIRRWWPRTSSAIIPLIVAPVMASGQSAPNQMPWNEESQSGENKGTGTNALEVGISEMNLVSGLPDGVEAQAVQAAYGDRVENSSISKPPGMGSVTVPSPISKPTHRKNDSSNSPSLTLTPNSSVDGNSDWNSLGNKTSPFRQPDHTQHPFIRGDEHSTGSFDAVRHEDGLLGLEALRGRAHSSPGPLSQSPPIGKSVLSGNLRVSQNRPPRSAVSGVDGAAGDRSVGERSLGEKSLGSAGSLGQLSFPSSTKPNEMSMNSIDPSDVLGLGAIARPELRTAASEFDPSRRKSASTDNFHSQQYMQNAAGHVPDHQAGVSQKFGSLPSLNSHLYQQRGGPGHGHPQQSFADLQRPRHIRSISQPGYDSHAAPPGQPVDPRFYQRSSSIPHHGYNPYEGGHMKRGSVQSLPAMHGGGGYPPLQRREALDFIQAPDDGRNYSPSLISPGQSPHQMSYNSRGYSESSMMASPVSHSSNAMRSHGSQGHDDDLTHPLVGEHIEVPSEVVGHNMAYPQRGGYRRTHAHSVSMDQLPAPYMDMNSSGLPKAVYNIKFKRSQRNFVLGPRISRDLKIGTYVKVEADRGEDLGIVVGKIPAEKYNYPSRSSYSAGMGPPGGSGLAELKRIVRLASHEEVSLLTLKREEEEELLNICRTKVIQRGLPMNVVDAEYQFDRHKLTFFFEAEGRVDFRELVRDLFSMYKTRIWMQQLDKTTATSSHAMMVPPEQSHQMDYGTPIIAPPSEFAESVTSGY